MQRSLLLKAAVVLVLVWGSVWAVAKWAGARTATPEKVVALLEANPLAGETDPDRRREAIEDVAGQINRLDFKQRQELRELGGQDGEGAFFRDMEEGEMLHFVDLTLETHFREAMKAFNEMEPEERQKFIDRAIKDMERDQSDRGIAAREDIGEEEMEMLEKVVETGMQAYYQSASAETKMDLAPLLERIQGRMQGMRR